RNGPGAVRGDRRHERQGPRELGIEGALRWRCCLPSEAGDEPAGLPDVYARIRAESGREGGCCRAAPGRSEAREADSFVKAREAPKEEGFFSSAPCCLNIAAGVEWPGVQGVSGR